MIIRNELETMHRDELDAFVQDEFDYVSKDFSSMMTNANKINLLLKEVLKEDPDGTRTSARLAAWRDARRGARTRACIAVLLLAAQGSVPAESTAEARAVRDALTRSKNGRTLDVQECRAETTAEIRDTIERLKPQAIHITMQGDGRALADGTNGGPPSTASPMALARSLEQAFLEAGIDVKHPLRLLTLSGHRSGECANHLGSVAACSVGMQGATSAKAEAVFYGTLYRDIGDGRSIATAFRRARTELGIHDPVQGDRPIMFAQSDAAANEALFPAKWLPPMPRSGILVAFVGHLVLVYLATTWLLEQYG